MNKKLIKKTGNISSYIEKTIYKPKDFIISIILLVYIVIIFTIPMSAMKFELALKSDFLAFYMGGNVAKQYSLNNLYNMEIQECVTKDIVQGDLVGLLTFRNTPIIASFYSIFADSGFVEAFYINLYIQFILLFVSVVLISLITRVGLSKFFLLLLSFHFLVSLFFVQITVFFLPVILICYFYLKKEKDFLAGLSTGLFFNKIHFLLFIPFLAITSKNRKKFITGSIVSVVLNLVINAFLYGRGFLLDYISFLFRSENNTKGTDITGNFSLISPGGLFQDKSYFLPSYLFYIFLCGLIYSILLWVFINKRKNLSLATAFSVSIVIPLSLNIHTMPVDYILLLLPMALLFSSTIKKEKFFAWTLYFLPWLGLLWWQPLIALLLLVGSFLLMVDGEIPLLNRIYKRLTRTVKSGINLLPLN